MLDSTALSRPRDLRDICATGPVSLFLDFDGTLVDLAPTPDGICVPDHLAAALHALAGTMHGRLALVSGRAISDIEKHLGALSIARAGSHGSDCRAADGTALGRAPEGLSDAALSEIVEFAEQSGFSREDKPHGAALHYRHDPALEDTGLAFADGFAARHGLAIKRGKCVIEFVIPGSDKGKAVAAFMAEAPFAGSTPIFVGDDITDEDGFQAARKAGGFGIIVGDKDSAAAQYRLADTNSVHQWLGL